MGIGEVNKMESNFFANEFTNYWNEKGHKLIRLNKKDRYESMYGMLSNCKTIGDIENEVCSMTARKESTRRVMVDFLRYLGRKKGKDDRLPEVSKTAKKEQSAGQNKKAVKDVKVDKRTKKEKSVVVVDSKKRKTDGKVVKSKKMRSEAKKQSAKVVKTRRKNGQEAKVKDNEKRRNKARSK